MGKKALSVVAFFCHNVNMKKGITILCLLCSSLLVQAHLHFPRKVGADVGKVWEHSSLGWSMQRMLARQMRQYRFKPFTPTSSKILQHNLRHFSQARQEKILKHYRSTLRETNSLAKDLNTKIFYQGTTESRLLSPFEIANDQRDILSALKEVRAAQVFFETPDETLARAETYLTRLSRFYQSCATGILEPLESEILSSLEKATQTFEPNRFFLRSPVSVEKESASLSLPRTLRVAIITDYGIREDFERMAKNENLSHWEFDGYANPEEFLNAPNHLAYDLVLTDVLISHGGGMYLARQLRHEGFEGGIIAATSFPEKAEIGIRLKASGMDGMIMLSDVDPYFILERPFTFAQKLRNYFYYKGQLPPATQEVAQPLPK